MHPWTSRTSHVGSLTSARFAPAPHVVAAVHDTDTALLDMRRERYYTLDVVGTRIWALVNEGQTVDEIAAHLAHEFDAPLATIEADLHALLTKLQAAELVFPSSGAGEP